MSMQRKERNRFAVVAANGQATPFNGRSPLARNHGQAITKREQKVLNEQHIQNLVIRLTGEKTNLAMQEIRGLHETGMVHFQEANHYIHEVKSRPGPKQCQAANDHFGSKLTEMLGDHLMGAIHIGATDIALEVERPLYQGPEPERAWWRRTLGF